MINLKREIKTIKGDSYVMSYPSEGDIKRAKDANGGSTVKLDDLPRETVGNVLINCIASYPVKHKKEVFVISKIGEWIMNDDPAKKPLNEDTMRFIIDDVLPFSTLQQDESATKSEEKVKGLYASWVINQVYDELEKRNELAPETPEIKEE